MSYTEIARSRRLGLTVAAVAALLGSVSPLCSGVALASSAPTSCPTAASIQSSAGEPLTRVSSSASKGAVLCVYTGKKQSSFALTVTPLPGLSKTVISAIESEVKSQMTATHGVDFTTIPRLGTGAIEFAQNKGARTGNGYPAVVLTVFTSGAEVTMDSDLPQKNILALAQKLI